MLRSAPARRPDRRERVWLGLALLLALAAGTCLLRLLITRGSGSSISLEWPNEQIREFRETSLKIGVIVGVGLAVSGVLLQALLRNPLAEPFILGVSSGAGLGVMASMYVGYRMYGAASAGGTHTGAAILGSIAVLAVVWLLGRRNGWLDPVSLVLVGVIISAIAGAGIMFFQHLVTEGLRNGFTLWLMGNIPEAIDRVSLWIAGGITAGGGAIACLLGRAMDAATLGDDEAQSVGVPIGPLRAGIFILAGALAAVTVALAGPIGFVGLIAPHAARLVLGPRHGPLVIGAALAGIVLVVGSDVVRQALDFGAGRMPIGIFTALIGGPAFIWLLLGKRGQA